MAITASVFIATSLDGFIARENGAIDWLMQANEIIPPGEDCGYAEFMSTVDVLVMGRNTYEQAAGFDPWPYEGKRVAVQPGFWALGRMITHENARFTHDRRIDMVRPLNP